LSRRNTSEKDSPGSRIRRARTLAGLTQQEVAEKTGLSDGYLSLIEGDRRQPSAAAVKLLSRALNISEAWISKGIGSMSGDTGESQETRSVADYIFNPNSNVIRRLRRILQADLPPELNRLSQRDIDEYRRETEKLKSELEREIRETLQRVIERGERHLHTIHGLILSRQQHRKK